MSGHRHKQREGVAVHELIMSFRGDMETTIAVFIAVAVDVLGRIAACCTSHSYIHVTYG